MTFKTAIFCTSFVVAQETGRIEEKYYQWFDDSMGIENTALYNGIGYVEKYKVINNYHKFYKSSDFLMGSIVYDGLRYFGMQMKYDLDEDLILLNLKKGLRIVLLQPLKSKVDGFYIDGSKFINIKTSSTNNTEVFGFYEVLVDDPNLNLLEKHKKKRFEKAGNSSVYYEFKNRNVIYLLYEKEFYPIKNRKDLIRIFPEFRKEIEAFSKKKFPKSNLRDYLITVVNKISELVTENNMLAQ